MQIVQCPYHLLHNGLDYRWVEATIRIIHLQLGHAAPHGFLNKTVVIAAQSRNGEKPQSIPQKKTSVVMWVCFVDVFVQSELVADSFTAGVDLQSNKTTPSI